MLRIISKDRYGFVAARLARPLSVPLRQLILLCSQKLHEQLTVGC